MEKLIHWVEAFNQIARNENNFHSFSIEKGENFVDASLTIENIAKEEQCRVGNFAKAAVVMSGGSAKLEITSGSYRKCPSQKGYVAEYNDEMSHVINLGSDPELLGLVKSIKNEGDFVALLEAVLQAASR